jgi:competence protein ComEA
MEQHPEKTRERVTGGGVLDTSAVLRGGSRKTSVARGAKGEGASRVSGAKWQRLRTLKESVWAPIALKAFGILAGMLALAGVGASSLARGAGVQVSAGSGAAGAAMAAGLSMLGKVEPGKAAARAAAETDAAPKRDAGAAVDAGTGSDGGNAADAGEVVSAAGVTADGKVILNRAGVDELCLLPGIGAKRAQAIIDLRTKLGGRFKKMADLLRLKGIGPKGLKKIEAKAVLDPA